MSLLTKTPVKEMIEEVAEFAERFPDQTDSEVIEFAEFMFERRIEPNTVLARILHTTYNNGKAAGEQVAEFFLTTL